MISPGSRPLPLDTAPQLPPRRQLGRAIHQWPYVPQHEKKIIETRGHRQDVRQHPEMMEKPLARSSYTQGGRGKPSSATSDTNWGESSSCSRICTFDVTNRKS